MSQTILIEPNENLRKIFTLNLNTYALTDVIGRENAKDAIDLLRILPSIDLIITTSQVGSEETAKVLLDYLAENSLKTPLIILGETAQLGTHQKSEFVAFKNPVSWEELVKKSAQILGVNSDLLELKKQEAFVPIPASYFYDINHTPCDVYIRIKKAGGEFQFVKRLNSQDAFKSEDIKKYEDSGLQNFYVPKDYQKYFVTFVTNNIIQSLEKNGLELRERLNLNSSAFEIVKDQIDIVGLDSTASDLADTCINSMVTSIEEAPKLSNLLRELLSNKISYAYQHAHLTTVIGDFILSKQKWYKNEHLELLTFVSFFSDICLKTEKEMRLNGDEELNNSDISDESKQNVLTHAKRASELVSDSYPHMKEAIRIIKEHHGSLSGEGFTTDANESLHAISKIFIICDSFVKVMLDPNGPKQKKDILSILYAKYSDSEFQEIIKVLESKID